MEEILPEYLDKVIADGVRSRLVIADIIDYGSTLHVCRNLQGFVRVVQRLKEGDKGARIELIKSNFIDRGVPAIGIVSTNRKSHLPSLAMVRFPIDDQRAARLMAAETHQLSRDEINVLAIDLSNIPGGIRDWKPLIQRRFQPNLNRRFGAVVLFTRVNQLHNANILRGYRVLRNPHAYRRVPDALLGAIENLDRQQA
jgi:hypothetical protein